MLHTSTLRESAALAREASADLAILSSELKNAILLDLASLLERDCAAILEANSADMADAENSDM